MNESLISGGNQNSDWIYGQVWITNFDSVAEPLDVLIIIDAVVHFISYADYDYLVSIMRHVLVAGHQIWWKRKSH